MRLVALLLLPTLAFAAPVPKAAEKPAVEATLAAESQGVLEITIRNNGKEPLELPYRVTPLELVTIALQGEKGKKYTIPPFGADDDIAGGRGTLTIPAGKSETLTVHTCHSLPELGERPQKVTFTARLKLGNKTIDATPLTVKP